MDAVQNSYYFQLNGICFLLLLWIIIKTKYNIDKQTRNILFLDVVFSTALLIVFDTLLMCIRDQNSPSSFYLKYSINVINFPFTALNTMFWFRYTLFEIGGVHHPKCRMKLLYSLPVILVTVLSLLSPWTHWLFSIDQKTGTFASGPLYFILIIITYIYFTAAGIIALISLIQKKHALNQPPELTILTFIIFPLVAGLLRVAIPGFEITWQMLTISLLFVFSETQFVQISTDPLTGLNNRRKFNSYMNMLDSAAREKPQCLFMIDINFFKNINDIYGHQEGDEALVQTAEILKKVFGEKDSFLARYGGDEFAAVCICENKSDAEQIRQELYNEFAVRNSDKKKKYPITVCAGYSLYTVGVESVDHLIKESDDDLYCEKKRIHMLHAKNINN